MAESGRKLAAAKAGGGRAATRTPPPAETVASAKLLVTPERGTDVHQYLFGTPRKPG